MSTNFPNIWVLPSNYWRHKGDKKHVPYSGPTNISCYCTKFSCHCDLVHGICQPVLEIVNVGCVKIKHKITVVLKKITLNLQFSSTNFTFIFLYFMGHKKKPET